MLLVGGDVGRGERQEVRLLVEVGAGLVEVGAGLVELGARLFQLHLRVLQVLLGLRLLRANARHLRAERCDGRAVAAALDAHEGHARDDREVGEHHRRHQEGALARLARYGLGGALGGFRCVFGLRLRCVFGLGFHSVLSRGRRSADLTVGHGARHHRRRVALGGGLLERVEQGRGGGQGRRFRSRGRRTTVGSERCSAGGAHLCELRRERRERHVRLRFRCPCDDRFRRGLGGRHRGVRGERAHVVVEHVRALRGRRLRGRRLGGPCRR